MAAGKVKTCENYVLAHEFGGRDTKIRIEHWEENGGKCGWAAHIDGMETPDEGYDAEDLECLAELFSAAAQKLRELKKS